MYARKFNCCCISIDREDAENTQDGEKCELHVDQKLLGLKTFDKISVL